MLGWLAFTGFAVYMFRDYAQWLWHYGHDLDPRAAIKLDAFTPPLIGYKQMANFKVWSLPGARNAAARRRVAAGPDRRSGWSVAPSAARRRAPPALRVALLLAALIARSRPCRRAPPPSPSTADAGCGGRGASPRPRRVTWCGSAPARTGVRSGSVDRSRSRGEPGAVLDGDGDGTVIEIAADHVTIEGLTIAGSGNRVVTARRRNSPREREPRRASRDSRSATCSTASTRSGRKASSSSNAVSWAASARWTRAVDGNGIHLWYTHDARLLDNSVERFLDGIYLSFADRTQVTGNRLQRCGRYGLHTMYCQENRLEGNVFERNVAGCAIMFSNQLVVSRNASCTTAARARTACCCATARRASSWTTVSSTTPSRSSWTTRTAIGFEGIWSRTTAGACCMFSSCAGNETAGNTFLNDDYPGGARHEPHGQPFRRRTRGQLLERECAVRPERRRRERRAVFARQRVRLRVEAVSRPLAPGQEPGCRGHRGRGASVPGAAAERRGRPLPARGADGGCRRPIGFGGDRRRPQARLGRILGVRRARNDAVFGLSRRRLQR